MNLPTPLDDNFAQHVLASVLLGQLVSPTGETAWFLLGHGDDGATAFKILPDHRRAQTLEEANAIVEGMLATSGSPLEVVPTPQFWSGAWGVRAPETL